MPALVVIGVRCCRPRRIAIVQLVGVLEAAGCTNRILRELVPLAIAIL